MTLVSISQVLDDKNVRRRFRASNYQSTTRVKPFICTMPMRLDDGWNQIQFNLSDFTRRAYGTNYIETLRVQVPGPCPDGAHMGRGMLCHWLGSHATEEWVSGLGPQVQGVLLRDSGRIWRANPLLSESTPGQGGDVATAPWVGEP